VRDIEIGGPLNAISHAEADARPACGMLSGSDTMAVVLLLIMMTLLLSVVQLPFVREQLAVDNCDWTPKMEVEQGIVLAFAAMYLLMAWVVGCRAAQERWFSPRASSHPHV